MLEVTMARPNVTHVTAAAAIATVSPFFNPPGGDR